MERTILVKAGKAGPVVLPEAVNGQRVVRDEPVAVVETRFIRRRLEVGDLVEVKTDAAAPAAPVVVAAAEQEAPDGAGEEH